MAVIRGGQVATNQPIIMEVVKMHKQVVEFAVEKTSEGQVKSIGKSIVWQPKTNFSGGSIKWLEDKVKSHK